MLCSSAWGEQLTPFWEFSLGSNKALTWGVTCFLQHGVVKPALQHSGANTEVHGQTLSKVCPRSFPAEGSAMSKSPWNKFITHHISTAAVVKLPYLPTATGTSHITFHLKTVSQIPNKIPQPAPLMVWSTAQSWCNHRNRSITKMVKTYFYFHTSDKAAPECSGKESAQRRVHLLGHDLHHLHHVPLVRHQHLEQSPPCARAVTPYPWQERLYTSNSHIKHSSSLTATVQPNTMWGNFEANKRNYLYFQVRHDPGDNMVANPYTQDMDLVPFSNMPGISEHPQLQHSPHKTLHPRCNHRSATRATTITTTPNWPNSSFCNFQSIQIYVDNCQHASSTLSTFMSQSFNLPSGTGRKLSTDRQSRYLTTMFMLLLYQMLT